MKKLLTILTNILLISLFFTSCGIWVKEPTIRQGKFKFSVTYEFNGEVSTFSDVYVCEYTGISWFIDGGFNRTWSSYTEGSKESDYDAVIGTTDDNGIIVLVTGFYPEYFMGDQVNGSLDAPKPSLSIVYGYENKDHLTILSDEEIIENTYHAKIINFEFDDPIKNTFK